MERQVGRPVFLIPLTHVRESLLKGVWGAVGGVQMTSSGTTAEPSLQYCADKLRRDAGQYCSCANRYIHRYTYNPFSLFTPTPLFRPHYPCSTRGPSIATEADFQAVYIKHRTLTAPHSSDLQLPPFPSQVRSQSFSLGVGADPEAIRLILKMLL
jgi:hypothetical protein